MGRDDRRRRGSPGVSEYRALLPEQVSTRQLLLALGGSETPAAAAPTLAEFFPRFLNQYARANRQKPAGVGSKESHFRIHLEALFGATPLDEIRADQVQELKAAIPGSSKTVNNVLSTLSKCLKVAVEWGVIERMPVVIRALPLQQPEFRFYEKAEYARLIIGARSAGPTELAVVLLAGDCGLRKGELIALEWRDLDFNRAQLSVVRSETKKKVTAPKGGRSRIVPMTVEVLESLKRIPRIGPRVFYRQDGEALTGHRICSFLSRAQRAAGLDAPGAMHILRHTYCSHLAMAGVPARTIQELAGHTSIRTTERYMHLAPAEKGRAIEQLEKYRQP